MLILVVVVFVLVLDGEGEGVGERGGHGVHGAGGEVVRELAVQRGLMWGGAKWRAIMTYLLDWGQAWENKESETERGREKVRGR